MLQPRPPEKGTDCARARHQERARQILAAHPEINALSNPTPSTAFLVAGLIALQLAMGLGLRGASWWVLFVAAYLVGAIANHALFVLIHECCHNLVFRGPIANRILAIVANIPLVVPTAMPFFRFHLLHHNHQGEMPHDLDLPGPWEATIIGRSWIGKALWLMWFPVIQGVVRPLRLPSVWTRDLWTMLNTVFQVTCMAMLAASAGWTPIAYGMLSTFFSIGLHPLGGRWIQEHYPFRDGQDTYSYYGPLNAVAFNMGFHHEHHDLASVPWSRLPRLRMLAREFYEPLYAHRSWSGLVWRFITDQQLGPDNRLPASTSQSEPR